ncbi:hypothetical protein Gotur_019569 [Gossypium turneri]
MIDVADPVFLELLKDENDGLAVWNAIGLLLGLLQYYKLQQIALRCSFSLSIDTDCLHLNLCSCLSFVALICALIPILMARNSTLFPDKNYMYEVCIHFGNISSVIVFLVGLLHCGYVLPSRYIHYQPDL